LPASWTTLAEAVRAPNLRERLLSEGAIPVRNTPEQFAVL
jgi:hypothetical protein